MNVTVGKQAGVCVNCGAVLTGTYCAQCGQKRFVESDRRFGHLVRQFVGSLTDLDGRVWRTLIALLFKPGLLSREYMEGRRARWISPVSLFLAVSVVYFVAPLHGGDLTLQFNQQVTGELRTLARSPDEKPLAAAALARNGQAHSAITSRWIAQRVQERDAAMRASSKGAAGYSYHDYRIAYDAKADDVSKALILVHIPFVALVLMLVFARQHRYFAEHFVFALHFFSFSILALEVVIQVRALALLTFPPGATPEWLFDWTMRTLLSVYAVLALRRAYGVGWLASIGAAAVMLTTLVTANIYIYRALQFVITFAIT